ncbi:MAG: two-component sensor histidine kinase [Sandaracinaceae bacterium]|nr:two-component sensor histidine kinase [Sandaracinaceae bacterium]
MSRDTSTPPPPPTVVRGWLAWGPIALAGAMAGILVASLVVSVIDVRRAAREIQRGQAEALLSAVREELLEGPMDADELLAVFEKHEPDGLRYLAVHGRPGHLAIGQAFSTRTRPPRPGEVEEVGGRIRLSQPLPVHPPPPPGMPPPMLVIEADPQLGSELEQTAQRTLIIGLVASLVVIGLGIALRRVLRQREALQLEAEQDRRLAALGQMSAVLAHEIRNPLASLKGHAQLLQEILPEGKAHDKAGRVVLEAKRLESLTNNLLDFVRTGQPRRRLVDPRQLVFAAAAEVGEDRFEVIVEGTPVEVSIDPNAMTRALTNVMRNAAQASEGTIDVTIRQPGHSLEIEVRDRGPGIPEEMLDRIFEAFETTRTRGTGLGLAVARRVVEGHGGTIAASNHPDGGAVMTLRVPRGAG